MRRNPTLRRLWTVKSGRSRNLVSRPDAPRLGAAAAAGLVLASVVVLVAPASAQEGDSEELAAQVDRIVARRASLGERISVFDEQANLAKAELSEVESRSKVNESDVASAEKTMTAARAQVRRYAVRAFTGGMGSGAVSSQENPTDVIRSRTLLATAQGNREQAVEDVRAARSDLGAKQKLLDETAEAKADAQQRITSARNEMKVAEKELATTETQVKGDLATALQREEQQRVAAERAEAERRQAEAAAQAEADRAETASDDSTEGDSAADEAPSPESDSSPSAPKSSAKASSESSPSSSSGQTQSASKTTAKPQAGSKAPSRSTPATAAPAGKAVQPTVPPTTAAPKPVAPPPTAAAPSPSSQGQRAVQAALSMRGTPYRWGGETPSGFDCSGLVLWAYAQAGRTGIPHSSRMQVSMGRRISVGELVPGDLVAYGSPVHHIGIYIGGGQYVHSPRTGDVVKVASIYRFNGTPIAVRI